MGIEILLKNMLSFTIIKDIYSDKNSSLKINESNIKIKKLRIGDLTKNLKKINET
jgi:hypothetical protein